MYRVLVLKYMDMSVNHEIKENFKMCNGNGHLVISLVIFWTKLSYIYKFVTLTSQSKNHSWLEY